MLYRVKVALLLLLLLSSCVEVEQYEDTPTGNFEALWHIIDTKYCFLDYKADEYGLDWDAVYRKYRPRVADGMSRAGLFEVLGDMLELGTVAEISHSETGKLAAENANLLFCYGELSKLMVSGAKEKGMENAFYFESKEELSEKLRKTAKPGDIIWLKASRGMRFEDIAEAFYEET